MASTRRTQPARLKNRDFMQPSAPIRLFVHTLDRHVDIHWHEFFELAFVISGEGEQILNGKPSRLSKGTLFLLTPADFHELTPAPGEPYVHYNLIFRDALSLQDAAGQANLSPNYFSKCFRQFTGMTYQHFLQDLRLQFAASLAKISDLPITEICFAAGFRTLSHFERAFKQKFGRSPRAYRTES